MKQSQRKHSPSCKVKVALEALKEKGDGSRASRAIRVEPELGADLEEGASGRC